jgi:hypothetical protein
VARSNRTVVEVKLDEQLGVKDVDQENSGDE